MKANGVTQKDVLFLTISMFVIVVSWISFNIYHRYATSGISPELQEQLTPIDANFDTTTIQQLKTRQQVTPLYQLPKSTPSAEIEPIASVPADLTTVTITITPVQTEQVPGSSRLNGPTLRP